MLPYGNTCSFKHQYKSKKGAITIFPWKERIQLWRPRTRYLNTLRLWAEPKIIHSVFCAKYGMQLPLTQPCSHVDKLSEATHAFTEPKGPKDTPEQTFFPQGRFDDSGLRFLQTHATNRYFETVNCGVFHCFFIRQLFHIITISNSLVRLHSCSHGTAAVLKCLCSLLDQTANQECFQTSCMKLHLYLL